MLLCCQPHFLGPGLARSTSSPRDTHFALQAVSLPSRPFPHQATASNTGRVVLFNTGQFRRGGVVGPAACARLESPGEAVTVLRWLPGGRLLAGTSAGTLLCYERGSAGFQNGSAVGILADSLGQVQLSPRSPPRQPLPAAALAPPAAAAAQQQRLPMPPAPPPAATDRAAGSGGSPKPMESLPSGGSDLVPAASEGPSSPLCDAPGGVTPQHALQEFEEARYYHDTQPAAQPPRRRSAGGMAAGMQGDASYGSQQSELPMQRESSGGSSFYDEPSPGRARAAPRPPRRMRSGSMRGGGGNGGSGSARGSSTLPPSPSTLSPSLMQHIMQLKEGPARGPDQQQQLAGWGLGEPC